MDEIKLLKPKFLLITRTPFSSATEDEISIQHVPKTTYNASYPIRTFSEEKFKKYLSDMYDVFEHWEDTLQADDDAVAKGILFIIKDVVK